MGKREEKMKISSLIKAMVLSFSILAIVSISLSSLSNQFATQVEQTYRSQITYREALMDMYLTTYRLFHLAHNYVVTLNNDYYQRYRTVLNQDLFDQGMQQYLQLSPTAEEVTKINQMHSNFSFFTYENERALEYVHVDWGTAVHILHNEEYSDIFTNLDSLLNEVNHAMLMRTGEEIARASMYKSMFNVLSLISVVLLGVTAVGGAVLIQMKLRPVGSLVDVLKNVTAGNFNINLRQNTDAKDEISVLANGMNSLVHTVKSINDDLTTFVHEYSVNGDIAYRIDETKYSGGYKDLISGINGYAEIVEDDIDSIFKVLEGVGQGDFSIMMKRMPGKKIELNEKIDDIQTKLKDINLEIGNMIDAAALKGDMKYNINTSKYEGDWNRITGGINKIADAVYHPIVEIRDVVSRLDEGYFDKTIKGDYPGDFGLIKTGVNGLIDRLGGYVKAIDQSLSAIAKGDLTKECNQQFVGEFVALGESIYTIRTTLHRTMSEINQASAQVLIGTKQISENAADLASGAVQQSESISELNIAIDKINEQTHQNAENAENANELSTKSTINAQEGNEAMKQMLEAMFQIKDSSNSISRIIKVIQDIAFQTNLLSLNAAVEAARAGEHGKGFSVVAEEVRNLASRSQTAATETTSLIEMSIDRVEAGSSIAGDTAQSLDVIVSNASEVLEIISNISEASKNQEQVVEQIAQELNRIAALIQNGSAATQKTASATGELNSQAEFLQELVSWFKL